MSFILLARTPFQILNPIVILFSVNMVHFRKVVWVWYKCHCDTPMYSNGSMLPVASYKEYQIPIRVFCGIKDMLFMPMHISV